MPCFSVGLISLNALICRRRAAVVARHLAAVDEAGQHVVVDRHAVRRDVAALAVKVALAHIERIDLERPGDLVDHALRHHHSLRAAEAAERGVRHRVGLHPPGGDRRRRQVIGIVGVEHRAIVDRGGQVRRIAAARRHLGLEREDDAVRVEADRVVRDEIVALAGEAHVVVAVEADLARLAGHARAERRDRGPLRSLRFLAAERAAHAAHLDRDRARREA